MLDQDETMTTAPELSEDSIDTEETVASFDTSDFESQTAALDTLQQQYDTLKDQYVRSIAEFENYKKRAQKEQTTTYNNAVTQTVQSLLDVFDNLERAGAIKDATKEDLDKGIDMILSQFNLCLEKLKIEVIDPKEEIFDPNLHNAVMHIEDPDLGKNMICEVFQKGYKIQDQVIRFAMVKVAN